MARRGSRKQSSPAMGKSKSMMPMHKAAMRRIATGHKMSGLKGSGGGKGMAGAC